MSIKNILDEIASESSTNKKIEILGNYQDNELLKRVMYLAKSKRVKFYIKQIPDWRTNGQLQTLEWALEQLEPLMKSELRGNDAIEHLSRVISSVKPDDSYVLERIIDRDLKIGMGTTNINKVFTKLIEKTPYMGAKPYEDKLVRKIFDKTNLGTRQGVYSQLKEDGRYCNAIIRGGEVELESRQGETTHVGNALFLRELAQLSDCVLNGELTVQGFDRYTANGIIASIVDIEKKRETRTEEETAKKIAAFVKKHGEYQDILDRIEYAVWDYIGVDEYFDQKSNVPYHFRFDCVLELNTIYPLTRIRPVETMVMDEYDDAMKHFLDVLDRGLEGTIIKDAEGTWKHGKPNWQVKMKVEMTMDLRAKGFNYGTKGTKNEDVISAIQLTSECGLLNTTASGMDEEMMQYVTDNMDSLMDTIFEIRCCGLSQDRDGNWSTLHPSIVKYRDDKDTGETLESAQAIEAAAKKLETV